MAILTINSGSSSLKFGLYSDRGQQLLLSGKAEEIGQEGSALTVSASDGRRIMQEQRPLSDQAEVLSQVAPYLIGSGAGAVSAIGHRIVHGGPHLTRHCLITPDVLATLQASVHFAPLHIPPALTLIAAAAKQYPGVPQFACFDTAFHTTLAPEAYTYALPKRYRDAGIRRFGFHGLSYASLVRALGPGCPAKLVAAHLGSGSSLCAIRDGRSVDVSMGFSPSGGIPMATRTGDLDPEIVLMLARGLPGGPPALGLDEVEAMLNHQCGLRALAGTGDMRLLSQRASGGDAEAELAIDIFCRSIAKTIASFAVVLGGLDALVFTGGIGEHSPEVRSRVCGQLALLGLRLSSDIDAAREEEISAADSRVRVLVIPADEDGEIARQVAALDQR